MDKYIKKKLKNQTWQFSYQIKQNLKQVNYPEREAHHIMIRGQSRKKVYQF